MATLHKSTYECEICHAINAAVHFHCAYCGTVPAQYSHTGKPIKLQESELENGINFAIPVVVAYGAQRQSQRRTVHFRPTTVRHDYYAESDFSLDKSRKV